MSAENPIVVPDSPKPIHLELAFEEERPSRDILVALNVLIKNIVDLRVVEAEVSVTNPCSGDAC